MNKEFYKTFDEDLARRLLVFLCFDKFSNLYLSESPDIISKPKSIGIEVTDATKQNLQEIKSHVSDIIGKDVSDLNINNIKNVLSGEIETCKVYKNKVVMAGPQAYWGGDFDFTIAIERKLNKLNSDVYTKFEENDLFIYAYNLTRFDMTVDKTFEEIRSIDYEKYPIKFDNIYIFTGNELIEYNLKEGNFKSMPLDLNILYKIQDVTKEYILSLQSRTNRN